MLRHDFGVSPGECRLLSALLQHADGLRTSELAVETGISRPVTSVLLTRLRRDGLVAHSWIPGTKGTVYVITDEGRKAREKFAQAAGLPMPATAVLMSVSQSTNTKTSEERG